MATTNGKMGTSADILIIDDIVCNPLTDEMIKYIKELEREIIIGLGCTKWTNADVIAAIEKPH